VFGQAVAFKKVAMGRGLWKSSCDKLAVEKVEAHLVK
jgi:hypothetical protein